MEVEVEDFEYLNNIELLKFKGSTEIKNEEDFLNIYLEFTDKRKSKTVDLDVEMTTNLETAIDNNYAKKLKKYSKSVEVDANKNIQNSKVINKKHYCEYCKKDFVRLKRHQMESCIGVHASNYFFGKPNEGRITCNDCGKIYIRGEKKKEGEEEKEKKPKTRKQKIIEEERRKKEEEEKNKKPKHDCRKDNLRKYKLDKNYLTTCKYCQRNFEETHDCKVKEVIDKIIAGNVNAVAENANRVKRQTKRVPVVNETKNERKSLLKEQKKIEEDRIRKILNYKAWIAERTERLVEEINFLKECENRYINGSSTEWDNEKNQISPEIFSNEYEKIFHGEGELPENEPGYSFIEYEKMIKNAIKKEIDKIKDTMIVKNEGIKIEDKIPHLGSINYPGHNYGRCEIEVGKNRIELIKKQELKKSKEEEIIRNEIERMLVEWKDQNSKPFVNFNQFQIETHEKNHLSRVAEYKIENKVSIFYRGKINDCLVSMDFEDIEEREILEENEMEDSDNKSKIESINKTRAFKIMSLIDSIKENNLNNIYNDNKMNFQQKYDEYGINEDENGQISKLVDRLNKNEIQIEKNKNFKKSLSAKFVEFEKKINFVFKRFDVERKSQLNKILIAVGFRDWLTRKQLLPSIKSTFNMIKRHSFTKINFFNFFQNCKKKFLIKNKKSVMSIVSRIIGYKRGNINYKEKIDDFANLSNSAFRHHMDDGVLLFDMSKTEYIKKVDNKKMEYIENERLKNIAKEKAEKEKRTEEFNKKMEAKMIEGKEYLNKMLLTWDPTRNLNISNFLKRKRESENYDDKKFKYNTKMTECYKYIRESTKNDDIEKQKNYDMEKQKNEEQIDSKAQMLKICEYVLKCNASERKEMEKDKDSDMNDLPVDKQSDDIFIRQNLNENIPDFIKVENHIDNLFNAPMSIGFVGKNNLDKIVNNEEIPDNCAEIKIKNGNNVKFKKKIIIKQQETKPLIKFEKNKYACPDEKNVIDDFNEERDYSNLCKKASRNQAHEYSYESEKFIPEKEIMANTRINLKFIKDEKTKMYEEQQEKLEKLVGLTLGSVKKMVDEKYKKMNTQNNSTENIKKIDNNSLVLKKLEESSKKSSEKLAIFEQTNKIDSQLKMKYIDFWRQQKIPSYKRLEYMKTICLNCKLLGHNDLQCKDLNINYETSKQVRHFERYNKIDSQLKIKYVNFWNKNNFTDLERFEYMRITCSKCKLVGHDNLQCDSLHTCSKCKVKHNDLKCEPLHKK